MSDEARGHSIKSRRLSHGIKSVRAFAVATGLSRDAISSAEEGHASEGTYERLEAWLDDFEQETGGDDVAPEPLKFTFHDVYGIGELIIEGPVDHPDQLVESVAKILAEIRRAATD